MTTVLVIGGYGTFGLRLVRLLADTPGLRVLVAGLSEENARKALESIKGAAELVPLALDRHKALDPPERPDIVVDAVGPFQSYGDTRDFVLDYCERVGATYVDLSDDPGFCAHLVERAARSPVTVATGWSTYSAVTGAVHHALGGGLPVRAGIVPSPRLPMGRAVIRSVLSYAGQPLGNGAHGLTQTLRRTVAPPGTTPMRSLLFSNVATPDAVLIDEDATGWTAPQPEGLHRMLVLMSRLVRLRLLPKLTLFAGLVHRVQAIIRIGEPRGGLFVEAGDRRWDLIGEGDTGPYVPAIPAAALIVAIHAGERFAPGLLRAGEAFPLARLTPYFDDLGIAYGERVERGPLYFRTLGGAMERLPAEIRDLHRNGRFRGRATVERGRNPLGRLVATVLGLPPEGEHEVVVEITEGPDGVERWSRRYDGQEMLSFQSEGAGRAAHTVVERFGPFAVWLGLSVEGEGLDARLRYTTRGWSFLGLPLPRALLPGGDVFEAVDEQGRFTFHVDMRAPGFGRLVRYRGWLERDD